MHSCKKQMFEYQKAHSESLYQKHTKNLFAENSYASHPGHHPKLRKKFWSSSPLAKPTSLLPGFSRIS